MVFGFWRSEAQRGLPGPKLRCRQGQLLLEAPRGNLTGLSLQRLPHPVARGPFRASLGLLLLLSRLLLTWPSCLHLARTLIIMLDSPGWSGTLSSSRQPQLHCTCKT